MAQRILVIDDEHDVRECVESLLSFLPDTHVEGASSFIEGRSRASETWDLVISDYVLPDGDGIALLAACEARSPDTPRVLMSAYAGDPRVLAAIESTTLSAFIAKPFDPDHVLERVRGLLLRRGRPSPA